MPSETGRSMTRLESKASCTWCPVQRGTTFLRLRNHRTERPDHEPKSKTRKECSKDTEEALRGTYLINAVQS